MSYNFIMKKRKVEKMFIDNGFGFPVILLNVPMIEIRGIWTPDIDYIKLTNQVLKSLVFKKSKLTGNEIKFIRLTFEMTLKEFANRFYVTHPCVIKWEKEEDNSTGMNWVTEKDIRLFVFDKISSNEDFRKVYLNLEKDIRDNSLEKTQIDIKELSIA